MKFNWKGLLYDENKVKERTKNDSWFTGEVDTLAINGVKELAFPDEIEEISFGTDDNFKLDFPNIETIQLPSNLKTFHAEMLSGLSTIKNVTISEENQNYSTEDGLVFNKEKTALLYYPKGRNATEYTVPSSVTSIDCGFSEFLTTINIPNTVKNINAGFWSSCTLNFANGKNEELIPQEYWWGAQRVIIQGEEVYNREG